MGKREQDRPGYLANAAVSRIPFCFGIRFLFLEQFPMRGGFAFEENSKRKSKKEAEREKRKVSNREREGKKKEEYAK